MSSSVRNMTGAERDLGALVLGHAVDEQGLALLDAVLLTAGSRLLRRWACRDLRASQDSLSVPERSTASGAGTAPSASAAAAPERRILDRRRHRHHPRRRLGRSVDQRRDRRGALDALDPDQLALADERRRAGHGDHAARRPGRPRRRRCTCAARRSRRSTSSPTANGSARRSISSRSPDSATSKVSIGSASPPSKRKCLPGSSSSSSSPLSWRISSRATCGLTRIRCASGSGLESTTSRSLRSASIATVSAERPRPRRRRSGTWSSGSRGRRR